MINKIIEFSVDNRLFVFCTSLVLIIFGFRSFQDLPIDAVPDITNTQVQINTKVDDLIPEEVERMVTFPVEYSVNGLPRVENVRSISRYGLSQVTVVFEEGFDIYKARQLVGEKLKTLELPEGIVPNIGPLSTGLGEIFHYSLEPKVKESDEKEHLKQLMELRSLQEWVIKPRLLGVKGVTEVNTIGGYEKRFYIQPDILAMSRHGIHFGDIERAIKNTNKNVGGGYIQQTGEQLLVRGVGLLSGFEDIENVVVKRLSTYKVVRIKDVAQVRFDKENRTGAATVNGQESIIGTAMMLLGENSRTVSTKVRETILDIKKNLPEWVELKILYNRSDMVNKTLGTLEHNLLMGAALVILFLMLLVGNLRAALITSLIIPLSLLITFILMRWQNVSGNLMSLGALDFGIIVDGAVIVIESCVFHLQKRAEELGRGLSRKEVKEVVKKAAIEIRSAAGFGELIVITVFIPLFALTGIEGKMFGPMALTFIMALGSALLLSFTLVPALAATFLSGETKDRPPYLMRVAQKVYLPLLNGALKVKRLILGGGVVAISLGLFLFSQMGSEFIPQLDEGDFALQFIRPSNINIEDSLKLQKYSEKIIKNYPQVKNVFARTGAAEVATDPMGVNIADTYVMLKDREEWPKDSSINTKEELMEAIKAEILLSVPGQVALLSQPVELRFNELLEGTKADVSLKVFGEDMDILTDLGQKMAALISSLPNAEGAESESQGKSPMIQYTPKKRRLANLGVTSRPVLDVIQTAIGGREVGHLYEGVKTFPIVMRLSRKTRQNISILNELPVGISEGFTVPIKDVAHIEFLDTFSFISRENAQRRIAVLINPKGRDVETFVEEAQNKINEEIKLPAGYHLEWGGSFKNLQRAKKQLVILVPLALLLILIMLYTAFRNISQVMLVFSCVPLALVGGVLSLMMMDIPFSISAGVGFIALSGISILNGVVLVTYFNRLSKKGETADDIVKKGAMMRLRPVLMTALTDIFGFLPMMFSSGLGAEVQRPLATVVVGGIFSSTILTLIIIPTLYSYFSLHQVKEGEA